MTTKNKNVIQNIRVIDEFQNTKQQIQACRTSTRKCCRDNKSLCGGDTPETHGDDPYGTLTPSDMTAPLSHTLPSSWAKKQRLTQHTKQGKPRDEMKEESRAVKTKCGAPSCLFTPSQTLQTLQEIKRELRRSLVSSYGMCHSLTSFSSSQKVSKSIALGQSINVLQQGFVTINYTHCTLLDNT